MISVYSFPRSGSNYLQALIAANLYPDVDLTVHGEWGHWSDRRPITTPHGKLFGSHGMPFHIQRPASPSSRSAKGEAVYVHRDGRAVALSIWRSAGFTNSSWTGVSLSAFLRRKLDWTMSPSCQVDPKMARTVIEEWLSHVTIWVEAARSGAFTPAGRILLVRYEDLVADPCYELERIAQHVGLEMPADFVSVHEKVGPSPNDARADAWCDHFTDDDLAYFGRFVSDGSELLIGRCDELWTVADIAHIT